VDEKKKKQDRSERGRDRLRWARWILRQSPSPRCSRSVSSVLRFVGFLDLVQGDGRYLYFSATTEDRVQARPDFSQESFFFLLLAKIKQTPIRIHVAFKVVFATSTVSV
jgi:hypothetical protein